MIRNFIKTILGISIASAFVREIPAQALQPAQVSTIANQTVVFIKTKSGHGSGVVVQKTGDTYTILTAAHVVNDRQSPPVEIATGDGQQYEIDPDSVKISPNRLDLATFTFQSEENYPVAQIGDSNTVMRGQAIFAAGFLGDTLQFYPGTVVAMARKPQENGYSLVIGNADIQPGMSGGALFDKSGVLVGINGKSVGTIDPKQNQNGRSNRAKPVSGIAIPINTFTQVASQLQVAVAYKPIPSPISSQTADDFFVSAQNKAQKGDYFGAIADYNSTLSLNPNFGEVYFRRGLARNVIHDWKGALADYTRALAVKSDHLEAYNNRGTIRNIIADWQGARSDFDVALGLNPQNVLAYVGRGIARCGLKDCQGGIQDYNRAIAINPAYTEAYISRAMAHRSLGDKHRAIADYQTAAEMYLHQGKDTDYLQTVQKIADLIGNPR